MLDNDKAQDVTIDSLILSDSYTPPKNPIVFCHGLSGFDRLILIPSVFQLTTLISNSIAHNMTENFMKDGEDESDTKYPNLVEIEYWIGVKKFLQSKGCTVITTKVPGFGSIEERATALDAQLRKEVQKIDSKDKRHSLNLIAHSMGGLDCRYLISNIKNRGYDILSLTTISTPHRGSEMADYVVDLFENLNSLRVPQKILPISFYQLTTTYMKYFNLVTPNSPKVSYFSYGCSFVPKWYNVFCTPWKIVYQRSKGRPNDGLVTIDSSRWGEYRGTLKGMDHLDVINWKNKLQDDWSKYFHTNTIEEKIDILNFYLKITDDLAKKGF
ncbi:hypothetical protein SEUBUCD646_0B01880 [Saccharomyces eubayanus]|uniref:Lipase 2 n=2 Tax=Saccharomyces TaxID=4930 RepID=A0A6C1E352_SACPS|nr:TGL2-like protein [Saccharomyces eubayanus]KOH00911.1 TGL2-like protein [Saccharomyces eubayanus]QID83401.1 lipase 2 [Saccharomyces pastorianus]CAI1818397.1 hypothetical protein SEUBUCD650_0B01890 [Saccharomyces eubayanus]CAI1853924.1 hypothetical protein SEUBUCD646_0B01880 [Saccharomyces eubayanus]